MWGQAPEIGEADIRNEEVWGSIPHGSTRESTPNRQGRIVVQSGNRSV